MQTSQREKVLSGAQTVTTRLLRDPVKEAVREALHEESRTVATDARSDTDRRDETSRTESSGRSKRSMGLVLLAIGGVAYLLRRRMQSDSGSGAFAQDRGRDEYSSGDTGRSTTTGSETSSSATTPSDEN